jgi:predicted acylesterase/phospholipase RssA
MTNVRYWMDEDPEALLKLARESQRREKEFLARSGREGLSPEVSGLAISGGGDNGAFGAGLLIGWTDAGNRPEFKLVTGISTGALIAPFAFLGPAYDDQLKSVYTTISAKDIFEKRTLLAAIYDDAMSDSRPLAGLIKKYVNDEMLREIAKEYQKGRLLFVATTNLDALRPVLWNMGEIAASGNPKALDLFRRILVASAAIPGAFPPVMIDVEAGGQRFQEMHVDGGAMAQVFVYPPSYRGDEKIRKSRKKKTLYIIRNARLDPNWAAVERRTLNILGRAISSLIQTQGIGDLYQIYLIAQRDGLDYNLAYIGDDFTVKKKGQFEMNYMRKLYGYAYQLAEKGYPWEKYPPGFAAPDTK